MMIEKKSIPLVSIDTMNETHFEEVEIVNSLFTQLNDKADFKSISESFDKLLSHMQEHFSTEEKLMKEIQYPSLQMHKADHDKVLNQTRYAEIQWRNKKDEEALVEFLEDDIVAWLDQHIKAMDTPMSDFVLQSPNFAN